MLLQVYIPIQCTAQRANPSVSASSLVAIGEVAVGHAKTVTLTLKNSGALACNYTVAAVAEEIEVPTPGPFDWIQVTKYSFVDSTYNASP